MIKRGLICVVAGLLIFSTFSSITLSKASSNVLDSIDIIHLKGGFGISAQIKNTGETTISDIAWSIDFTNSIIGKNSTGIISTISAQDTVQIRSGFVLGIGSGIAEVVVGDFSFLQRYFIIGPFVFLKYGCENKLKNRDMIVYYRDHNHHTLDPAEAYDDESENIISNVYDTLVTYKGNDTQTVYPSLALNWTVASDQLTWTFHLRHGVKFSNGNAFDASDVKYSLDRVLLVNSPDTSVAWILSQCMDLNSTTILDPYTVQVRLTNTYGGFLSIIAFTVASIVDKEYVEAHGGVIPNQDNEWMKEHPMGTGPYMVDNRTGTNETLLVKNPNYWGGWDGNHIEKIFFKTCVDLKERISAIKSGDADFTYIPYSNLNNITCKNCISVQPYTSYNVRVLIINTRNIFLNDYRVRQALSYAFDYETVISSALNGYAVRQAGAIPVGMPFYLTQNSGQPYYNYNLTKAEKILDEAGYPKNFEHNGSLYRFNGTSIRIFYNSGNLEREKIAFILQASLDQIGILSTVTAEGWPQYLNRIFHTNEWEIVFLGWQPDYNDPDDYVVSFVGSSNVGGDTFNTGWGNVSVDNYLMQGRYTLDEQARAAAYTAAFNIYIQQPPLIFISQEQYIRPMRTWVFNYNYNPAPGCNMKFYDCYKSLQ